MSSMYGIGEAHPRGDENNAIPQAKRVRTQPSDEIIFNLGHLPKDIIRIVGTYLASKVELLVKVGCFPLITGALNQSGREAKHLLTYAQRKQYMPNEGKLLNHFYAEYEQEQSLRTHLNLSLRKLTIHSDFTNARVAAIAAIFSNLQDLYLNFAAVQGHLDEVGVNALRSLTELETLQLSHVSFETPNGLSSLTQLKTLEVDVCVNLASVSCLRITELVANQRRLENNELHAIAQLPRLETLSLQCCHLKSTQLQPLSSLTHLTDLDLTDNRITDLAPLSPLTQLRKLVLPGCDIIHGAALHQFKHLTRLYLDSEVCMFPHLTALNYLTNFTHTHVKMLSQHLPSLGKMTSLTRLMLTDGFFLLDKPEDIAPLGKLTNLNELSLDLVCWGQHPDRGTNPQESLALTSTLCKLTQLADLGLCLGNFDLKVIDHLVQLSGLKTLGLEFKKVVVGPFLVNQLGRLPALNFVNFIGCIENSAATPLLDQLRERIGGQVLRQEADVEMEDFVR